MLRLRHVVLASLLVAGAGCASLAGLSGSSDDASADGSAPARDAHPLADTGTRDTGSGHDAGRQDAAAHDAASHDDVTPEDATNDGGGAFAATVMDDSPLAYYPMEELSGAVLHDVGMLHADGAYGTGIQLGAAGVLPGTHSPHFPGGTYSTANLAQVPPLEVLEPSASLSVELFVVEDAVNVAGSAIELLVSGPEESEAFSVQISIDNHFEFWLPAVGLTADFTSETTLVPGQVYQVDATYDGTTARLYVNGVLDGSALASGAVDFGEVGNYGLGFGGPLDQTERWTLRGRIGQVSMYGVALSPEQIMAHWAHSGLAAAADAGGDDGS